MEWHCLLPDILKDCTFLKVYHQSSRHPLDISLEIEGEYTLEIFSCVPGVNWEFKSLEDNVTISSQFEKP